MTKMRGKRRQWTRREKRREEREDKKEVHEPLESIWIKAIFFFFFLRSLFSSLKSETIVTRSGICQREIQGFPSPSRNWVSFFSRNGAARWKRATRCSTRIHRFNCISRRILYPLATNYYTWAWFIARFMKNTRRARVPRAPHRLRETGEPRLNGCVTSFSLSSPLGVHSLHCDRATSSSSSSSSPFSSASRSCSILFHLAHALLMSAAGETRLREILPLCNSCVHARFLLAARQRKRYKSTPREFREFRSFVVSWS